MFHRAPVLQLGVIFDATETDTTTAGEVEYTGGFCIDYKQAAC